MKNFFVFLLLAGCAEDIAPEGAPAEPDAEPPPPDQPDASPDQPDAAPTYPNLVHHDEGQGVTLSEIDARDQNAWIHVDFETMAQVDEASPAWDAAFRRFRLDLQGGAALAALPGQAFDAVVAAPAAESFVEDSDEAGLAIEQDGGWYAYDPETHELTPFDITYVLRTSEGGFVKLRFVDYYDAVGTSGFPSIRWTFLP
jgi:hypothetical protein